MNKSLGRIAAGVFLIGLGFGLASPAEADTVVVLVRHAEKAEGKDPALTSAGEDRAKTLAAILLPMRMDAVVVSPFERTRQTAAPLARVLELTPIEVGVDKGIQQHVEEVTDVVRSLADHSAVLIVGHSNTVPRLVEALGGPQLDDIQHHEYDRLFLLVIPTEGAPRFLESQFGMPSIRVHDD